VKQLGFNPMVRISTRSAPGTESTQRVRKRSNIYSQAKQMTAQDASDGIAVTDGAGPFSKCGEEVVEFEGAR
jgi:hypothetical protein